MKEYNNLKDFFKINKNTLACTLTMTKTITISIVLCFEISEFLKNNVPCYHHGQEYPEFYH